MLSKVRSYLNEVELALFHLGKEVKFSHCRTSVKLYALEEGPLASSTCIRLSKVKPVTRLQIPPLVKKQIVEQHAKLISEKDLEE